MAYLYPNVIRESKSPAEKELFARFKNFSDDFHIIHSLPWLSKYVQKEFKKEGKKFTPEGEADFIILHKDFGILCLEIKGGRITYEQHAYFNRSGQLNKNPYDQARESKYLVKDIIQNLIKKVVVGYAVGFPHVTSPFFNEETKNITFDKNDLLNLENRVIKIYEYWQVKQYKNKLSSHEIQQIIKLLIPDSQEILNDKIEYDNLHWLNLSPNQNKIIEKALNSKRYFISGMAGTGKTILAIILARILGKNKKILFLTFNKEIQKNILDNFHKNINIDVFTFHRFLSENNDLKDKKDVVTYSNDILNYIIESSINKYDVLIIDEAQSLIASWLKGLNEYFSNKQIYIFSDELQSFSYEGKITNKQMRKIFDFNDETILTLNYRSPKKVYKRLLEMFSTSVEQYSPRDIDTLDLNERITFYPKKIIEETIDNLLLENVKKENIVILIPGREKRHISFYKYKAISVKTVEEYRGMESPIVIYVITSVSERDLHEFYVAYSRATTRTVVIIYESVLSFGTTYFEKMLIESEVTEKKLKKRIKNSFKDYINEIINDCTPLEVFNCKIYILKKYIFLLNSDKKFVDKLLIDYFLEQNIPIVHMSDYHLKYANLRNKSSKDITLLEYKLCEICYQKTFTNNEYCVNCKLENLDENLLDNVKSDLIVLTNKKPKSDGLLLHDSLRSIGRFYYVRLNKIITEIMLEILNKQLDVKYISCIIEFLIVLNTYDRDEISLDYIRTKNSVRKLNCSYENWNEITGQCISIFIKNEQFEKIKKGYYRIKKENLFLPSKL